MDDFDDGSLDVLFDVDDEAQQNYDVKEMEEEMKVGRLSPPRNQHQQHRFNLDSDPNVERQITSLAQVSNLFPDESLGTIHTLLESCDYDAEIVITQLNDAKRFDNMPREDISVPIDEQKVPKRKITSPGTEPGPQMKQTKSLPESSGVVPKRHTPEDIESRIDTILDMFPHANDRAIRHRLEESTHLDTVVTEVINELENGEKMEEGPGPSKRRTDDDDEPTLKVKIDRKMEEKLSNEEKENLVHVTQIFPDVDPHFVSEQIAIQGRSLEDIVNRMTNNSSYPKLKQRLEKERQERRRQEFLNSGGFDIEAYLHLFEDPETYFNDQTRNMTDLYTRHAKVHLMNSFRNMREDFLQRQLRSHNNHFLPTYRTITEGISQTDADGRRRKPRNFGMPIYSGEIRPVAQWPEEIDEMFFRELQYHEHQDEIKEFISERTRQREQREDEAEINGQLIECQCCFNNNKLPEDMIACQQNNTHSFCRGCVRQHAETQVAEGFHRVSCISNDCSAEYDIRILQILLSPANMDILLRRRQQDEVRNAQLDNMESCPFCDFAMVIENTNEKVFKCQNPNCLRESCRQCKEPNHIPKRCDEVIKDAEIRMRTYVENKMAEAWIRICPNCNKRIIKTSGCNALHCPCGTGICYVCNEVLPKNGCVYYGGHFKSGFGFFRGHDRDHPSAKHSSCPLQTELNEVNADVAERAGKEARALYLKENPEVEEKAKIDDQHVEQLVDRDADRRGQVDGEFYQHGRLAGDLPEWIWQRLAGYDHNRQEQDREMVRRALFEQRHEDLRERERQRLNKLRMTAKRRVNEISSERDQLRQDIVRYEMRILNLERATKGKRAENSNQEKSLDYMRNNLEALRRSRDDALNNLQLLEREQEYAATVENRIAQHLQQGHVVENIGGIREFEEEEQQLNDERWQGQRNQLLVDRRRFMEPVNRLRRLHPQLNEVYAAVAQLQQGIESTDAQRQLVQFHDTQNNLLDRLNQHLTRDEADFNELMERETRELISEINKHLNEMRQFMCRAKSQPATKIAEASSSITAHTEALRRLELLTELEKTEAREEKKEGKIQKLRGTIKQGLADSKSATKVSKESEKTEYLKTLNERIQALDNQLKDAQRNMINGLSGDGPSLMQLMQQRDDVITERNGLEATLLRDGIEEEQFNRNDAQYDLTPAENAEAIRLARNAVARREPSETVQPAVRIQFQQGHGQGQVPIREVGGGIHMLHDNAVRQRVGSLVQRFPPLHPQEREPKEIADIQDRKPGIKGILKPTHSSSSSASEAAALEARRRAMIHAQEMREEEILIEHDRLNRESRDVRRQIQELLQRERQIEEEMGVSEQRLAQSREQHSRKMDHLNGRVHEMQINSQIQSQEAHSSATGDEVDQSSCNKQSETEEQRAPVEVTIEADEPQSTVVLFEEDVEMDSMDSDKTDIEEDGNKKKRINAIVESVKESIPNVERQEVVHALLKVRENMGGKFEKRKFSELVQLVVVELKPVCAVIPSQRNSAKISNITIPQSTPTVNQPVINDQKQETVMDQGTTEVGSPNIMPKIENQNERASTSVESDDATFTMRIGHRDGHFNINIQLPRTQSQQNSHSARNSQSDTQSESNQNIAAVNLETKTGNGDVEFADLGNENQI